MVQETAYIVPYVHNVLIDNRAQYVLQEPTESTRSAEAYTM